MLNRRVSNALRVAQNAWDLDTTGDVDEKTFKRMLKALRDRGQAEPQGISLGRPVDELYENAEERVPAEKCFVLPAGVEVCRRGGGSADHGRRPLGNWQSDNAIDVHAKPLTPILAPKAGIVSKIGGHDPHDGPVGTIFGEHVTIKCSEATSSSSPTPIESSA